MRLTRAGLRYLEASLDSLEKLLPCCAGSEWAVIDHTRDEAEFWQIAPNGRRVGLGVVVHFGGGFTLVAHTATVGPEPTLMAAIDAWEKACRTTR